MANDDLIYRRLKTEAIVVAEKCGTWVFHRLKDEKNVEHMIGYMIGRTDDFERRKSKMRAEGTRRHLSDRMSSWSRALRFIHGVKNSAYSELCKRLLADFDRDPSYSHLRYVSQNEVDSNIDVSRRTKLTAKPPRANGRPRSYVVQQTDFKPCGRCKGAGFFRR